MVLEPSLYIYLQIFAVLTSVCDFESGCCHHFSRRISHFSPSAFKHIHKKHEGGVFLEFDIIMLSVRMEFFKPAPLLLLQWWLAAGGDADRNEC